MKNIELYKLIDQIVNRLLNGEQVEENRTELKSCWYNFSYKENRKKIESEFLKDLAAIANTPGPTGYLIVGINEKNGEIINSPFNKCGLNDISELYKLVVKSVDKPVDFELKEIPYQFEENKYIISILIIPPSLLKPHLITRYFSKSGQEIQNFIPVKKLTNIFPANRSDLELMYYDRKNIEPEFALEIKSYNPRLAISGNESEIRIEFQICFENFGFKPVTIVDIKMAISEMNNDDTPDVLNFNLDKYHTNDTVRGDDFNLPLRYLIIPSNEVKTVYLKFKTFLSRSFSYKTRDFLEKYRGKYVVIVESVDINNKKYQAEIKYS